MGPLLSIPRLLRNYARMDAGLKGLVMEAALALLLARLTLLILPFPRIAKRLGVFVPAADPRAQAGMLAGDVRAAQTAWRVRRAVASAARHVPFKAVCLPQAMAAQALLRRRGISSVMHFGAAFGDTKPIDAHAWLDAAGVPVTGYPVAPKLAEIACFV